MESVGSRIQAVFDAMDKDDVGGALTQLYHAVEQTAASGRFGSSLPDAELRFLRESVWVILAVWLGGVIVPDLRLPVLGDVQQSVPLEGILLDLMRTAARGQESPAVWHEKKVLMMDNSGRLHVGKDLVWGIVMAVVTSETNVAERIDNECQMQLGQSRYLVNSLWGHRESLRTMICSQYDVKL